jgi:hypothetical protein
MQCRLLISRGTLRPLHLSSWSGLESVHITSFLSYHPHRLTFALCDRVNTALVTETGLEQPHVIQDEKNTTP